MATEREITNWIRNILKKNYGPGDEISPPAAGLPNVESGRWVSAKYLYAQLVAHPERYGAPSAYVLPKLDKFERVCRAMFFTRVEKGELVVRVQ